MRIRRSLVVGLGFIIVAACGQVSGNRSPGAKILTTKQDLQAQPEKYTGADLQDHEIALTFDDGPGPMAVSGALAQWLHDHKDPKTGAAAPIRATFFVLGACIASTTLGDDPDKNEACGEPTDDADAVLAKEVSLGHYIGNHTTTHRNMIDLVNSDPGDVAEELMEDDALISKYLVWNRMFFRAPQGDWNNADFNKVKNTAMNKYTGPIYWNEGGGGGDPPVTADLAADWACWLGPNGDGKSKPVYSTHECGDRYLKEIRANGNRGIILMHDAKGDTDNHDLDKAPGNTFDMLKYIMGELEKDDTPWKWKRLDEVPSIAAELPPCDAACTECKGPAATDCTACTADKHVDATGTCVAGAPAVDGGTDDDDDTTSTSSSSGVSTNPSGSSSGNSATSGGIADAGTAAAKDDGGCNTSGSSEKKSDLAGVALLGLAAAISLRSKRRRT